MFYIGMLFFSLAIASGLWGFANVGVEVDSVARLIFYTSLFAASSAFATCLLRTAARARSDANEDEPGDAAMDDSSGASRSALCGAEEVEVPAPRSKPVVRSSWRSPPGAGESWVGAGPVHASESAIRAGGIGQEV